MQMAEVQLPETAKLRLHHFWAKDIRPLQYKELVHVHGQGLLFLTMVNMHSGNDFFLEGCMRARVDGTQTLLSSGTEDYFLRSFYFDTVPLASDASGVLQVRHTCRYTTRATLAEGVEVSPTCQMVRNQCGNGSSEGNHALSMVARSRDQHSICVCFACELQKEKQGNGPSQYPCVVGCKWQTTLHGSPCAKRQQNSRQASQTASSRNNKHECGKSWST